tara:strand:+ start:25 stop:174 length:150 start_codon:yes stop_codon:yes gene_type:complete
MFHYGYFVHAKIITMTFEELHVIDGMVYCHEINKYVTVEEYTEYYYGTH